MGNVKTLQNRQLRSADDTADLRIRLFGPMSITRGGKRIIIASRKGRALVGYLALRQGIEFARISLTGLLWGERSEDQARASLRQTLSELRRALGPLAQHSIVATKETVTWVPGLAWVDAKAVEDLSGSKDKEALKEAAELISGDLMEGLSVGEAPYEEWLASERERFRLTRCGIYVRLMDDAEQGGRFEEALTYGLKLLALDPLHEPVHRALMRLYAAQGRHDAALSQYERCRRELSQQLGVPPDMETEELVRAIRASRRAGTAGTPFPSGRAPSARQSDRSELQDRASIAVLPFTNLSGDPEQRYFADGIAEDIITELSRYRSLLVIARNSCFQFRGDVDVADVRSALGVRYVVEGSVRKSGQRVRVAAQLIDALDRCQVWAERYDRESLDIFAVQDEVARAVVATLEGRVAARGAEHTRRKPTADWVAYDYFLQGRELSYGFRHTEAERFFARAVELDPGYVHAHAWRAIALGVSYLHDAREDTLDAAFASARTALALDDNDARCHYAMAYVALRRCEYDLAGRHHDRAQSLNPGDPDIAAGRANWLMHIGRLDEALATLDTALERDPFPPTWVWNVRGCVLYHLERYAEAINAFRSVRAEPFWTIGMLAAAYAQAGRRDDAHRELERYLAIKPGATLGTVTDKIIYATDAMRQRWLDGLRKAGMPE
ncbi:MULTISPECIES: BTAD domain-containing putative transcriptional regulator [unclassified Mesorhizobium]|nr:MULTISPECIES: BTAD domain-containing putative transcriptional regulator [unclassified Mesorhizobium]